VVLQQFAGIEETFYGFVVKTGIDACGSRGRVYGRCRVWRDVERVGGARGSSGETLYPLERERFVWCSSGTCVERERPFDDTELDR